MKKPTFRERFSYWFDNHMSQGSFALIRLLSITSVLIVLLIASCIFLLKLNDSGGFGEALWESLVTMINAWMPEYGDGDKVYLVFMTVAAVAGLFLTSVLIGIIASGIEEKINDLKRGNSLVLEENHIVVLGFQAGEYTLLRQLVLAAGKRSCCIVVADDLEKEEVLRLIRENVEYGPNIRIIARTIDIFDPVDLVKLSLEQARTVIVSPMDDRRTVKALLAVSAIINESQNDRVRVGAIVSKDEYRFPSSVAKRHNVTTLQTHDIIARIIAHSCTQPGLSMAFKELFNFEGSELYLIDMPQAKGATFEELICRMDCAVPVGVYTEGKMRINPDKHMVIQKGDRILVFSEEHDSAFLRDGEEAGAEIVYREDTIAMDPAGRVVIVGYSDTLDTILCELPENVVDVLIADVKEEQKEGILEAIEQRGKISVSFFDKKIKKKGVLTELAQQADHLIILSDHDADPEEADIRNIFLLLNFRDIRLKNRLHFNITAEMRSEHNQNLVVTDDNTDFVVSSSMSALFLAQIAESPELSLAFKELLSNEGNELYLLNAEEYRCVGEYTVLELRRRMMEHHHILMGFILEKDGSVFNPRLDECVELTEKDRLVVLSEGI